MFRYILSFKILQLILFVLLPISASIRHPSSNLSVPRFFIILRRLLICLLSLAFLFLFPYVECSPCAAYSDDDDDWEEDDDVSIEGHGYCHVAPRALYDKLPQVHQVMLRVGTSNVIAFYRSQLLPNAPGVASVLSPLFAMIV